MKSHADRNMKWLGLVLFMGLAVTITLALPAGVNAAASKGPEIFKSKCQMCHGPSGKNGPMHLKDLGSAEVQKLSNAQLHEIITKGKSPMPAFGSQLSKEQVNELVSYIRSLKGK
jgi:cytochrome c6